MAYRQDIQQDSEGQVLLLDNDLVISNSDDQHIEDTLKANKGWWKENPSDGVNINQYYKGVRVEQELERNAKIQLQSDGYRSNPRAYYNTKDELVINPNVTL